MSQRTVRVDDEITVDLSFRVNIRSFSNHEGFYEGQVAGAIDEFTAKIRDELESKVCGEYQQQEFLDAVDFVTYEVDVE
jgi:hypothetical protein